jgi:hypothetical protein
LTKADGLTFRKWWQDRVVDEGVQIKTANKSIGTVSRMLRKVSEAKELGLPAILSGLRIEGGVTRQRPPFEISFIQDRIMANGAFGTLNSEARRVIYVMVETGMRPSETVNLTPNTIHFNHRVPHVSIRSAGAGYSSPTSSARHKRKITTIALGSAA